MRFPDSEAMVLAFLGMQVAPVPVHTKLPTPPTGTFVRVWRSGGATVNRILDQPLITVQAWAPDPATASQLAHTCREAMLRHHAILPLVRGVTETEGLRYDPDTEGEAATGADRYTFTLQLQVRATR